MTGDRRPTARQRYITLAVTAATTLAGCGEGVPSVLAPHGPRAGELAVVSWILFTLATIVFAVVMGLYAYALWRTRRADPGTGGEGAGVPPPNLASPGPATRYILIGGVAVPSVILLVLMGVTVGAMDTMAPPARRADVVVEVIGRQFWWEVRYPQEDFTTANEIHVPVGRTVEVRVSSPDVIHSFWVPQLTPKIDMIPGKTNVVWIEASDAGTFRGHCAEFCGIQHARMLFYVVAEPPEQYDRWVAQQRQPASEPQSIVARAGMQAIMRPSCIGCHTIRGTAAQGTGGPDLTHVGSRLTIAGGILARNVGTLAGWIADPQHLKPGNKMPDLQVDLDTAHAMAVYLDGLK